MSVMKVVVVIHRGLINIIVFYHFFLRYCHLMRIETFRPLTAGLHEAMVSTGRVSLYVAP